MSHPHPGVGFFMGMIAGHAMGEMEVSEVVN